MRTILHVDMDAFFAAVEVRDHPEWAGRPLVVGSPPDRRGVVSTASYEARVYGIHSAMPSRTAFQRCPQALFVPVRMSRYIEVSDAIMTIIGRFTPAVEQVSVDEAFLDVSGVLRRWTSAEAIAIALKKAIREETGLTASVGVASNKFLAKLGSDLEKPDGLTVVPDEPAEIMAFLAPMPVSRIWGVGEVTERLLHAAGFRTIGDLQSVSIGTLVPVVGPALATHIGTLARGEDDRRVVTEYETKSISAENTFDVDVEDPETVRLELIGLVEQVGRRLRAASRLAHTVFIKIRSSDFQTVSRQETMEVPVCSDRRLIECAMVLLGKQRFRQPVRLIGFGVSGLIPAHQTQPQLELFSDPARERELKNGRLDRVVDRLRERMGEDAITRASRLRHDPGGT